VAGTGIARVAAISWGIPTPNRASWWASPPYDKGTHTVRGRMS
jgi:hypothetical protein